MLREEPKSEKIREIDEEKDRVWGIIFGITEKMKELKKLGYIKEKVCEEIQEKLRSQWTGYHTCGHGPFDPSIRESFSNKNLQKTSYLLMQALSKPYREKENGK